MSSFIKKTKGITLIALVITIIVLLILAGVAISMLSGENGILKQASKAKQDIQNASIKESIKLAISDALIKGQGKVDLSENGDLHQALETMISGEYTYEDGGMITINGKVYGVTERGEVYDDVKMSTLKLMWGNGSGGQNYDGERNISNTYRVIDLDFFSKEIIEDYPNEEFLSWYYDENYTKEAHTGDWLTGDTILYPKFKGINGHITYVVNGSTYNYKQVISSSVTFDGIRELKYNKDNQSSWFVDEWFYDADFKNKANEGDWLTGDTTLYGKPMGISLSSCIYGEIIDSMTGVTIRPWDGSSR